MAKRNPSIDEEEMRRVLGNQGPLLDAYQSSDDPPVKKSAEQPKTGAEEPITEIRRRRTALPDFEQAFMNPQDIRNRSAIYVSGDTKRKIFEVVRNIGSDRMTATSYVENIIRHHLSLYKEEINRLYEERKNDTLL